MAECLRALASCCACSDYLQDPVYLKCRYVCCLDTLERGPGGEGLLCPACPEVSMPEDIMPARQLGALAKTLQQHESKLQVILKMKRSLWRFQVDMTLDVDTANNHLLISEDLRSVGCVSSSQTRRECAQRFDIMCVLGSPRFTSGSHYWEVDVGSCQEWDVGICRDSVNRKGPVSLNSECSFWTVRRIQRNRLEASTVRFEASTVPLTLLQLELCIERVSIVLNMSLTRVSFYNTRNRDHIFTFTNIPTDSPLQPFFAPRRAPDRQQGTLSLPMAAGRHSARPPAPAAQGGSASAQKRRRRKRK